MVFCEDMNKNLVLIPFQYKEQLSPSTIYILQ